MELSVKLSCHRWKLIISDAFTIADHIINVSIYKIIKYLYKISAVAAVLRGLPYTPRSTPSHPSSSFSEVMRAN